LPQAAMGCVKKAVWVLFSYYCKGAVSNLVDLRTSPLLWAAEMHWFSPTAHSAIRGRPEKVFRGILSRNVTIRVSGRGTEQLNLGNRVFLSPSLGPELAPFQSLFA
jgi:hypothetical protein